MRPHWVVEAAFSDSLGMTICSKIVRLTVKQVACFSLGRSHFSTKLFYFCVIPRSNIFNKEPWVQTLLVEKFHPHSIIIALPILDHRDHRLQKTYQLFLFWEEPPLANHKTIKPMVPLVACHPPLQNQWYHHGSLTSKGGLSSLKIGSSLTPASIDLISPCLGSEMTVQKHT